MNHSREPSSPSRSSPGARRGLAPRLGGLLLTPALLATLGVGCRVIDKTTEMPVKAVMTAVPGAKSGPLDPAALQLELQRYADDFTGRSIWAIDEYASRVGTDAARSRALEWKLGVASAAFGITSGPHPTANLLDFLALSTLTRAVLEEYWLKTENGPAFQPWLDTSRVLETNAWKLTEGVLTPAQQKEIRSAIRQWHKANPGARTAFLARPQEFASLVRSSPEKTESPGGIFTFVGLDPTAALDPAVREVTRTRLFAERAMFTAQRMVSVLRLQTELLIDRLVHQNQIALALTNAARLTESADRLSRATESASQAAVQLPDRITAERKAVLQVLEDQAGKLRELAAEVGRTLGAGERMSASLHTTLTTFDALMKRFGVGEPKPDARPSTNAAPFNILDYAHTAEQLAVTAKELDLLLKDANATLDSPAWQKRFQDVGLLAQRATRDAKSVLNHGFLLGGGLVLLGFACALAYRRLAPRQAGTKPRTE